MIKLTVDRNKLLTTNKIIPLDGERAFRATNSDLVLGNHRDRVMNRSHNGQLHEEFVVGDIKNLARSAISVEFIEPKSITRRTAEKLGDALIAATRWADEHNVKLIVDEKLRNEWEEYA